MSPQPGIPEQLSCTGMPRQVRSASVLVVRIIVHEYATTLLADNLTILTLTQTLTPLLAEDRLRSRHRMPGQLC